ncbi:phage tail assembly chaperone G [Brochothrix thermosphacta]|uniref:Phage protein n=1 Tax=Brochothrix thermosphacta TaxID=2756 RepID=A0A2X0QWF7_BROTH|nr:hypothetical protein [Brochothrix thermosphacta]SPP28468.1 conserved hypothetical protein [Brochothrix thermosphacta]
MAKITIKGKSYFSSKVNLGKKKDALKLISKYEEMEKERELSIHEQIEAMEEIADFIEGCFISESVTADAIFEICYELEDLQKLLGDVLGGQQDPKQQMRQQQHKKR